MNELSKILRRLRMKSFLFGELIQLNITMVRDTSKVALSNTLVVFLTQLIALLRWKIAKNISQGHQKQDVFVPQASILTWYRQLNENNHGK